MNTYTFKRGNGDTTINNDDNGAGREDILKFSAGIYFDDVTVSRPTGSDDLQLTVKSINGGSDEIITLVNFFAGSRYEIDAVAFESNSAVVWDANALRSIVAHKVTEYPDEIQGDGNNDTIYGLGGGDELRGGAGADELYGGDGVDELYGEAGEDTLNGGDGSDELYGGADNDELYGGAGDDELYGGEGDDILRGNSSSAGGMGDILDGGAGNDSYLFGRLDGKTTIINNDAGEGRRDILRFLAGINPDHVNVSRVDKDGEESKAGSDLLFTVSDSDGSVNESEAITVVNFFAGNQHAIDAVEFVDNRDTVWTTDILQSMAIFNTNEDANIITGTPDNDIIYGLGGDDTLSGDAGNDELHGGEGNDTLRGNAGEDRLYGGAGDDTYQFGRFDGLTFIHNDDDSVVRQDTLHFLQGINPNDITVGAFRNDLELRVGSNPQDTSDIIRVVDFFSGSRYEIDKIKFSDGTGGVPDTEWDSAYIAANFFTTAGTPGKDIIRGGSDGVTLHGLGGNDHIYGGAGGDELHGGDNNDYLYGGAGADSLFGGAGDDELRGGTGSGDELYGEAGNDTYLFGRGDGRTFIRNNDTTDSKDKLRFLAGINPGHVSVSRATGSDDLLLTVRGSEGSRDEVITVKRFFAKDQINNQYELHSVEFADGTVWNAGTLKIQVTLTDQHDIMRAGDEYIGDDYLNGLGGNDTLRGGAGEDILIGGTGRDTLLGGTKNDKLFGGAGVDELRGGSGNDQLHGEAGRDELRGGSGDDQLYGGARNDELYGGTDNDALYGGDGDDELYGGAGDDILQGNSSSADGVGDILDGGAGDDSYLFGRGDGKTTINNDDAGVGRRDTLRFLAGIKPSDVSATRSNNNLLLTVHSIDTNNSEVITVVKFFADSRHALNAIEFTDTPDIIWNTETIKIQVTLTEGDDQGVDDQGVLGHEKNDALGVTGDDYLNGLGGDDTISGLSGNDRLFGGSGDDQLFGGAGNDILRGNSSSADGIGDRLDGGAGDDTYLFGRGDGDTTINNNDAGEGRRDILRFLTGINPIDIKASRGYNSDNLLLTVRSNDGSSAAEVITVVNFFTEDADTVNDQYKLNAVEFAGAPDTVWGSNVLRSMAIFGTTEDGDVVIGNGDGETIYALGGDDIVRSLGGNDVIYGGAGNDELYGGEGDDTLRGDAGTDDLYGDAGNDTYQFGRGDGATFIHNDDDDANRKDILRFLEGITPDHVTASRATDSDVSADRATSTDDLLLTVASIDGSSPTEIITVVDLFAKNQVNNQYELNEIVFTSDDGDIVWNINAPKSRVLFGATDGHDVLEGTAGDDIIYGLGGNDTLRGGEGNDELHGGAGDDTYEFGKGDGSTFIHNDDAAVGHKDTLRFLAGISPSDVNISRATDSDVSADRATSIDDLLLTVQSSTTNSAGEKVITQEVITVVGFFATGQVNGQHELNAVEFADSSTVWDSDALKSIVRFSATHAGETIEGDVDTANANDIIYGLGGNDALTGLRGNDELYGGEGNDLLFGKADDDILHGGIGNDLLQGDAGNDTYLFGRGDGKDIINNNDVDTGSTDILRFLAGITPSNITVSASANGLDLLVADPAVIGDSGDSVALRNFFTGSRHEIDKIEFSDGTVWDSAHIANTYFKSAGTPGDDIIIGTSGLDILNGQEGNDYLYGGEGQDILIGGTGEDTLNGGAGSDTYNFVRGHGNTTIYNDDDGANSRDTLTFFSGINPGDVSSSRVNTEGVKDIAGNDLRLTVKSIDERPDDIITVVNFFADDRFQIDAVEFADGTVWNAKTIEIQVTFTEQNDTRDGHNKVGEPGDDNYLSGDDYLNGLGGNDSISGLNGNDQLFGGEGDDTLRGGEDNDTLRGNAGNDTLYGDAGNDTYLFGRGDGQDIINNNDGDTGSTDILRFLAGITPSNITVSASANGLDLLVADPAVIGDSGDSVKLRDFFKDSQYEIDEIRFSDGIGGIPDTVWDFADIATTYFKSAGTGGDDIIIGTSGLNVLNGQEGNDYLYGGEGQDILIGGEGEDTLNGGAGSDTYNFVRGHGTTTIYNDDDGANSRDTLTFFSGINPGDVRSSRVNTEGVKDIAGNDLRLTVKSIDERPDDIITVVNFFADDRFQIDAVEFADGTVWNAKTIEIQVTFTEQNDTRDGHNKVGAIGDANYLSGDDYLNGLGGNDSISGLNGNDSLFGGEGDDTLRGGEGNDTLRGNAGNDTLYGDAGDDSYIFGIGDGKTTIHNDDDAAVRTDKLRFLEGITPDDVRASRVDTAGVEDKEGDNLLLTVESRAPNSDGKEIITQEVITVVNFFATGQVNGQYELNAVEFSDATATTAATVWNTATLKELVLVPVATNDRDIFRGSDKADVFDALGGNDELYGGGGNDILRGGADHDILQGDKGTDNLYGDAGNDTYLFNIGDGATFIHNDDDGEGRKDILRFLAGIKPSDVSVSRATDSDVSASRATSSDDLLLTVESNDGSGSKEEVIAVVKFFAGSRYELDAVEFSDGTATTVATVWNTKALKNLALVATEEDDIIVGNANKNIIDGLGGDDELRGGEGHDELYGGAGDDELFGDGGNDILRGNSNSENGLGDRLDGGAGDDTYQFGRGDGNTTINNDDADGTDKLHFLQDINPEHVSATRVDTDGVEDIAGSDLRLTVKSIDESPDEIITVVNFFADDRFQIDAVEFADGTIWNAKTIEIQVTFTEESDIRNGHNKVGAIGDSDYLSGDDYLNGLGGNDTIHGLGGNDELYGGDGDDELYGGEGHDTLRGGEGLDFLEGDAGNDTYLFGRGDGLDIIIKEEGREDILRFLAGIKPSDVRAHGVSDELVLNIRENGKSIADNVVFWNFFAGSQYELNAVEFADGTVWNPAYIAENFFVSEGTNGRDIIIGTSGVDMLNGLISNDSLYGGDGDDVLHGGRGNDWVLGQNGKDTLYGDAHNDELHGGEGDDELYGGDGNDRLFSGDDNDLLQGDDGNDGLFAGAGNDILRGGADSDSLWGEDDDDELYGGSGDDRLRGGSGNDTYHFSVGFGVDIIRNYNSIVNDDVDVARFDDNFSVEDLWFSRVNDTFGDDLRINVVGTNDQITIDGWYRGGNQLDKFEVGSGTSKFVLLNSQVDRLVTAMAAYSVPSGEGSVVTQEMKDALAPTIGAVWRIRGTEGDDIIVGNANNNTIDGLGGDDTLRGGAGTDNLHGDAGNDTYKFGIGDGATFIHNDDNAVGRRDILRFLAGIDPSDVSISRATDSNDLPLDDDLLLTVESRSENSDGEEVITQEVITVVKFFAGSRYELNAVEFEDSRTVWDADALKSIVKFGATNAKDIITGDVDDDNKNDIIYGLGGNDTLSGLSGNDSLFGGAGDDTLRGGEGEDKLYGGAGDDSYEFGIGDGATFIHNDDDGENRNDKLRFLAGINSSNVSTSRAANSDDLLLTVESRTPNSNGETIIKKEVITVVDFFAGSRHELNAVEFADSSTVWNADTLDALKSPNGLYEFGRGDGNTTINNDDGGEGRRDILRFLAGINPGDVSISRATDSQNLPLDDLLLTVQSRVPNSAGETIIKKEVITVVDFFVADQVNGQYEINAVEFEDSSTVWDADALKSIVQFGATHERDIITGSNDNDDIIYGLGGHDELRGGDGHDELYGGAGRDFLYGGEGNDTLRGGDGHDTLYGEAGNDTYLFSIGDGATFIHNDDDVAGRNDKLRFLAGIKPSDVSVSRATDSDVSANRATSADDLLLTVESNDGSGSKEEVIAVVNFFAENQVNGQYELNAVEFADSSTVWDSDALKSIVKFGVTHADNIITGDVDDGNKNDIIYGLGGNDTLSGLSGNDILFGGAGADTLRGGAGTDNLYGDAGNDTYLFSIGDGATFIHNDDNATGRIDKLRFLAGIKPSDVGVTRIAGSNNLLLAVQSSDENSDGEEVITKEVITVVDFFAADQVNGQYELDAVEFEDSSTVWDADALKSIVKFGATHDRDIITGTDENDIIYGLGGSDELRGGDGHDELYGGAGHDFLYGDDDNDELYGGEGRDSLFGGEGNDTLRGGKDRDSFSGGEGNDTYLFGRGDGRDLIRNDDDGEGHRDLLRFLEGINPDDITARGIVTDLVLDVRSNGQLTGDCIHIRSFFGGSRHEIDAIEFADGTVWNSEDIAKRFFTTEATNGDDIFKGTSSVDMFNGGDGDDHIYGQNGNDVLHGGDDQDVIYGQNDDDTLYGDGGDDWLRGGDGDDTLHGGADNDSLRGEAGDDAYLFNASFGVDTIYNHDTSVGRTDVARFRDHFSIQDLWFSRVDNRFSIHDNLRINVVGTEDQVTINDWYKGSDYQLDKFEIGNSSVGSSFRATSVLLNAQVDRLVTAMAAYSVPSGVGSVVTQEMKDALAPTIAAVWKTETTI